MNVKITEKSVTFKVTEEELGILATGQALEKETSMGGRNFAMVIDPEPAKYCDGCAPDSLQLILDTDEACLIYFTSKNQIQKLVDMGKNKDGLIISTDNGLDVILQVDVRADSRPRKKD